MLSAVLHFKNVSEREVKVPFKTLNFERLFKGHLKRE